VTNLACEDDHEQQARFMARNLTPPIREVARPTQPFRGAADTAGTMPNQFLDAWSRAANTHDLLALHTERWGAPPTEHVASGDEWAGVMGIER
jgi:hypothetical protein